MPGPYAAGDTATRELICGGFPGGGSHNAAWAVSSGRWAGRGAAAFAARRGHPADALFVAPPASAARAGSRFRDVPGLETSGLLGGYRRELGWGRGRVLRARTAVGLTDYPD